MNAKLSDLIIEGQKWRRKNRVAKTDHAYVRALHPQGYACCPLAAAYCAATGRTPQEAKEDQENGLIFEWAKAFGTVPSNKIKTERLSKISADIPAALVVTAYTDDGKPVSEVIKALKALGM